MVEDVFGIVGSVIGSAYHVESVVAEGGFGVVYRAHQGGFRAPVALKLLKVPEQNPQQQAAFLQLFRSEAELLFRLSASLPSVVRALHVDAFTSKDGRFVPYLVLEWLDGMTLATLVTQRKRANLAPVPLRKLVRLLTPIARALERAQHFSGPDGPVSIVHRDLKPDNIFVAQMAGEEVVKILDFGIGKVKSLASQVAGRMSQDGNVPIAFSPAYGAPEQWAPQHYGQTGPWTDVWGLALCLVEVMAARRLIEGDPATMMGIALDPKRRPTPRNEGIAVPDAIEAVFERALALDPRERQPHVGVFWNELVAAIDQVEADAKDLSIEAADDLEFDPTSARRPSAAPVRVSAPYSIPISAPARARGLSRPPAPAALSAPGQMRAAAVSAAHFVPDLELAPPSVSRRPSGERPVVAEPTAPQHTAPQPQELELDSASMPQALDLHLDLPADEPRAQRSMSSQSLAAVRPSAHKPSKPPPRSFSGSMPALREPLPPGAPTSGVLSTRSASAEFGSGDPARTMHHSRPPPSADVSASFEAGFVAKIEPKPREERGLPRRLRPAIALFSAAILVAIFDPIYAATTGKLLEILGQRLSLLAGVLLLLALAVAVREVTRDG